MENAESLPKALFHPSSAGPGPTVSSGGALTDAPNHDLIAAIGNDRNLLEINPFTQHQVATYGGAANRFNLFH